MIYLKPREAPAFFLRYQSSLRAQRKIIASDSGKRTIIQLSATNSGKCPRITVVTSCDVVDDFIVPHVSSLECVLNDMYKEYKMKESKELESDRAIEISDREAQIEDAIIDFLDVVLSSKKDKMYSDELIKDCKEHFLNYIYDNYDCDIYRPMYLCKENEELVFCRYPYESLREDV